jgi:hypothetical protein
MAEVHPKRGGCRQKINEFMLDLEVDKAKRRRKRIDCARPGRDSDVMEFDTAEKFWGEISRRSGIPVDTLIRDLAQEALQREVSDNYSVVLRYAATPK